MISDELSLFCHMFLKCHCHFVGNFSRSVGHSIHNHHNLSHQLLFKVKLAVNSSCFNYTLLVSAKLFLQTVVGVDPLLIAKMQLLWQSINRSLYESNFWQTRKSFSNKFIKYQWFYNIFLFLTMVKSFYTITD